MNVPLPKEPSRVILNALDPDSPQPVILGARRFLTQGVELRGLLIHLVQTMVTELSAERGTLYLVDGSAKTLTSIVAHLPELERIDLGFGQGLAGTAAESGRLINTKDPAGDPRHDGTFDDQTGFRTRCLLTVPISDSRAQVIGVMQVLNASSGHFSIEDEASARRLAKQAGKVLEATSLYAELRRRGPLEGPRPALAFHFNQIVGESEPMRAVYELLRKAARTDATVLLAGETGTGKELIARAIHVNGPRARGPFVKVDCTALPEALIENELFGHERGAFTGADRATQGKLEVAHGGTLFLDELGELPLHLQGKLLRVLQDRAFERVGGTRTVQTDIRIICATHRHLAAMVDAGEFREDLYYRVRVVPIEIPTLRDWGRDDLLRLVEHFVEKYRRRHGREIRQVTQDALSRLVEHDYPGNIRELEHCIESAVVLCEAGVIDAKDLPLPERRRVPAVSVRPQIGDPELSLSQVEHAHIREVLAACDGNRSEAARRLGIGRNTLVRKIDD